jgi:probable phosphoglycerate mutase
VAKHIHLVRHGHHALLGRVLCGRMPGVQLDALGCRQMAAAAADIIRQSAPSSLQSSPQRRALQSAGIVGARCGLPVEIADAFDEIDMGEWTGAEFADLGSNQGWQRWNESRSSTQPPNGEGMLALQTRVVSHLEQLADCGGSIVIVSHAEPIRAALMHYLAIGLDDFHSVTVDPASISTILFDGRRRCVRRLNGEVLA